MAADDTKSAKADTVAPAAPPSSGGREERAAHQKSTAPPQVPPAVGTPAVSKTAEETTAEGEAKAAAKSAEANGRVMGDESKLPAPEPEADKLTEAMPRELTEGLQVEVRFQLGELILPLKALANLQPEQVLTPLNGFAFPKVKALSAGRVFAEGELVRVGERIGFRVTKLYN